MVLNPAGKLGIGTQAPLRKLDINAADGNCMRLIYNDSDGSATNYADFIMSSAGDMIITPSSAVIRPAVTATGFIHYI